MPEEQEDQEFTSSDEYEAQALEALGKGAQVAAGIYATLALAATVREATFVLADIIAPEEEEEEDDEA